MSKASLRPVLCLLIGLGPGGYGFSATAQSTDAATYNPPVQREDGWSVAAAGTAGFNEAALAALTQEIRDGVSLNTHAVLVEKAGRLVYEAYFEGPDERLGEPLGNVVFDHQTLHDLRSVSKSVTSALLGIALGGDYETALATPLPAYFPDLKHRFAPDLGQVTLQHALTMTAGLEWNEMAVPYSLDAILSAMFGPKAKLILGFPKVRLFCIGGVAARLIRVVMGLGHRRGRIFTGEERCRSRRMLAGFLFAQVVYKPTAYLLRFGPSDKLICDCVLSCLLKIPVILRLAVEIAEVNIVGPQHTTIFVDHGDLFQCSISSVMHEE